MNTFTGNVGSVELKFTPGGKAVCEVSFAEGHRKKDGDQWVDDGTTWRRATFWEGHAEEVAQHVKKGDRIMVTGTERLREWEAKDGSKGKSLEVKPKDIAVVVKPPKKEGFGGNYGGQSQQPAQQWGGAPNDAANWGVPSGQGPAF